MKSLHLVCILSLFLFSQCNKENPEPTLPPETTVGANTFGAIVNGEIWSFDKDKGDPIGASLALNDLLSLSAGFDNDTDRRESISIAVFGVAVQVQSYFFSTDDSSVNGDFNYTNLDMLCIYNRSVNENTVFNGSLEITYLDKVRQIVSGRFEFEIFIDGEPREGTNACGVIKVESGRFDLKYNN
jgi:hypothetical protein